MYKTQLDEGDSKLRHIEKVIEYKRNLLLEKQREYNKISKTNRFLHDIKDDYVKYHKYILNQKKEQILALGILTNYINDLEESGGLTKNNIVDANYEKKRILTEIDSIKSSLDDLIKDM